MTYTLKLWSTEAYVSRAEFIYAWLTFGRHQKAELFLLDAKICAPSLKKLSRFVGELPTYSDTLRLIQKRRWRGKHIEWRRGPNSICLPSRANTKKIFARFTKLLSEIEPLLELAEVISAQVQRRPLKTDSVADFIGFDQIDGMSVDQWLAIRKEAGKKIDPATAVVFEHFVQLLDPYGVKKPPEIFGCLGKEVFVRSPDSDIWVWDGDLPAKTYQALYRRFEEQRAQPGEPDEEEKVFEL